MDLSYQRSDEPTPASLEHSNAFYAVTFKLAQLTKFCMLSITASVSPVALSIEAIYYRDEPQSTFKIIKEENICTMLRTPSQGLNRPKLAAEYILTTVTDCLVRWAQ